MSFLHKLQAQDPVQGSLTYDDVNEASIAAQLNEEAQSRLVIVSSKDGVMSVRIFARSPPGQRSLVLCADCAQGVLAHVRAED